MKEQSSRNGMTSPGAGDRSRSITTRSRLANCWEIDIDWDKYPEFLREV